MRSRSLPVFLALVTALAVPPHAEAQQADQLSVGARVRVHRLNGQPRIVTGVLVRADSVGVTIAAPDDSSPQLITAADVARLEQHVGTRSPGAALGRGAGRGALAGLALSAVLMGAALVTEQRDPCRDCMITSPVAAGIVAVPLTAASALIGGLVGIGTRERWARVPYP